MLIPTLLGILALTFLIIQFVPGGPVEQLMAELSGSGAAAEAASGGGGMAGRTRLNADDIAALNALYGFDKPPLTRFGEMLARFARFDLGNSFFHHETVAELIRQKLPVSMSLGLWTFFLTYLICIPLGIMKAVRDGSRFDTLTGLVILVGYTIPPFVLGLLLLVLFGGGSFFAWFPQGGLTGDNWDQLSTAGKIERKILFKHIFRNAMIPLITGFPAAFIGAFFTGSLLIETLFSLDGLGLLSYEAVLKRDYPVVMGTLYVFTLMGLTARLLTDLSYAWADPRIHFGSGR